MHDGIQDITGSRGSGGVLLLYARRREGVLNTTAIAEVLLVLGHSLLLEAALKTRQTPGRNSAM